MAKAAKKSTKKAPKAPKSKPKAKTAPKKLAARVPRANRITQNDIIRPMEHSVCGQVWAIADSITAKKRAKGDKKAWATRGEVCEVADAKGFTPGNTRAEFQRWRIFNGVPVATGEGSRAPRKAAAPKPPKAKKAAKAAKKAKTAPTAPRAKKAAPPAPPKAPAAKQAPPPPPAA